MKYKKFEYELRHELRKALEVLEIYSFLILIHKCQFLEDFENN